MVELSKIKLPILLCILQSIFIVVFFQFAKYGEEEEISGAKGNQDNKYPLFQDVHAMMFVGFGFLMVFLKKYGYSSVGINMLLTVVCLQWATVVRGFMHMDDDKMFSINIHRMMEADFAAATVLISFGAVLGLTSPLQLIVMAFIEIVIAQINEYIGFNKLMVTDQGESIFVHIFGAYFGLGVARIVARNVKTDKEENNGASYTSDLFAMIGTVFLWIYWPSFNGALAEGAVLERCYVNTYYSLCASALTTFALSWLLNGKLDMVHVQNATLAGGVAVGAVANLDIKPFGALIVGHIAGAVSVLGYQYISPAMAKVKFADTCGVHNLHGMPGVIAGIAAAVAAVTAKCEDRPEFFRNTFGAIVNESVTGNDTCDSEQFIRSQAAQAGMQIVAVLMTLLIAIVCGVLTGLLISLSIFDPPKTNYSDENNWLMEGDEEEGGAAGDAPDNNNNDDAAENVPLKSVDA